MSGTGFYAAFEERHRGSRELIESRLSVYLPFVHAVAQFHPGAMLTDLGCGRGEWLELLRQHGFAAQGVDLDAGMLQACRERGLDVYQGDAIEFLRQLPDGSQAAVSGFHIAEHLPFEMLQSLVMQALRVLRPGGLLILETPNPENLVVGSSGFYMDPTHERPLPPPLLAFLPEYCGFGRVKVLRLHHGRELEQLQARVNLEDVLAGVSPDYAVIAQTPLDDASLDQRTLDAAFAQDHGVTLHELAQRRELQWEARVHEVHIEATQAQNTADAARASTAKSMEQVSAALHGVVEQLTASEQAIRETIRSELEQRASALEGGFGRQITLLEHKTRQQLGSLDSKVTQQLVAAQREAWQSRHELESMYNSTSWRITAPIRWFASQVKAVREQGLGQRTRRVGHRIVGGTARRALRTLDRHPRLRRFVVSTIRRLGLGQLAERARARLSVPVAPAAAAHLMPQEAVLSPAARRIHDELCRAVQRHAPATEEGNP